ncbi:endoribonuclease MazF [Rhodoferax sediminis]|jgi:mRNA interferase MazF|uniref:Endoribonuclease MazF n=1 Tax=Rhodoferax sediminis TaxID=2509614 RepID=A0A515DF12_9BURK|nr:endoribonuclease MazF [Rhodoferax sediminis]QDL39008.1 endoribonuclease MazF [Rhodoferax sediminis]
MATRGYVPDSGDVVWLQFDPRAGHEQAGHRPALVISPAAYNAKSGLMVCCPMSTKIKGHPFEVVTEVDGVPSAILSDQVKSLDWKVRRAKRKSAVSPEVMLHVRAKIKALLVLK